MKNILKVVLCSLIVIPGFALAQETESKLDQAHNSDAAAVPVPTPIVVDFKACQHAEGTVWGDFGSTTYMIAGESWSDCVFRYGGEVENPRALYRMVNICVVPKTFGSMTFAVDHAGLADFSPIHDYCAQIKTKRKTK